MDFVWVSYLVGITTVVRELTISLNYVKAERTHAILLSWAGLLVVMWVA